MKNISKVRSDVKAKQAFVEKLLNEGYDTAVVAKEPADVIATKDGVTWYFEIKKTSRKKRYFGAATFTEWAQAFRTPEVFRFVVAKTNEDETEFEFVSYTPAEFMQFSTIPPIKVFFNIDFETGARARKAGAKSLQMSEEAFQALAKVYSNLKG